MRVAKISDYALIGNSRSAALVSKYGSIDWCCLPEFHSPAVFAALLDPRGGHFSIAPPGPFEPQQRYLPDTNVVETIFTTTTGQAKITDAYTAGTEEQKTRSLFPDHEILRIVECISGTVTFQMEYAPAVFYGLERPQLKDNAKLGISFSYKENTFVLLSNSESITVHGDCARCEFSLQPGESRIFSLSCSGQSPAILPETKTTARQRMDRTVSYWKNWIGSCRYEGLYLDHVKRSALALKLLAHAPSGAIIAAPTTSLPEQPGGMRNWDYRYCWLRDASFTVRVLIRLGFEHEAHAYMNWILHATRLTRPRLQVVYSVFGNTALTEKTLPWLQGFQNSQPVEIGNEAYSQLQLDVYGEVLDAVYSYSKLVDGFSKDSRKFIAGLAETILKYWDCPDNGIWEVRSTPAHHTHSKVMAWVGADRILKLAQKHNWKNVPTRKYEDVKRAIESEVDLFGYNDRLEAYAGVLGGDALDASALVFPLVGFCDAASPKMRSTTDQIMKRLSRNKLLHRYAQGNDGLPGGEGAFGICNFWLVENLAETDRMSEAIELFETMLTFSGPTGLFSEEIDPVSGELWGNYPQGFTHIGLINAALSINQAATQKGGIL